MRKLRNRFERFCLRHRNWGIPNLMLYVLIGNGLVYLLSALNIAPQIMNYLFFDRSLVLQGQVWRLFTYVFLDMRENPIFMILFMYVYYSISKQIENQWGTFRFNLFYFSGIILTDIFCMTVKGFSFMDVLFGSQALFTSYSLSALYMVRYLHLSLFMAYATLNPDSGFLMFFIIPVKGWMLALIDLVLTGYDIYRYPFPFCLVPVIALVNFALFFGGDLVNLLPPAWRRRLMQRKRKRQATTPTVITFTPVKTRPAPKKEDFTHRCTVCGRTDVTNPELEFRYCSRCNGYHCYCEEHISNHTHIP